MIRKRKPNTAKTRNKRKQKKGKSAPAHLLPAPFALDLKPHLESVKGRPTLYKPEYCAKIILLMAEGKSKATAAVELGIDRATLLNWAHAQPEFLIAIKKAEELSKRWWEEIGRANIHNKQFNAVLYMMNMSNRFGWSRAQEGTAGEESVEDSIKALQFVEKEKTVKHEHTHKHEVNIGERTTEHIASVLRILAESGAFTATAEDSSDTETNKIH